MIGNASHTKTALPDKDNSHAESSRNTACDTAMIKLSVPRPEIIGDDGYPRRAPPSGQQV